MAKPEPSAALRHKRPRSTPAWVKPGLYGGAGLLLIGSIVYVVWSSRPVIDRSVTEGASFPVYVPTKVPASYKLEADKTQLTSDMLTYTFESTAKSAHEVVVTVQPLPSDFNMTKLIGSGTVQSTTTANGTLYDLSTSQKTQFLLHTGDALVFFTSAGIIDTATISALAGDLAKQK